MSRATRDAEPPLSPTHRQTLRDLHQHMTIPGREFCVGDGQDWPCDVIALLDALEVAEGKIMAVATLGKRLSWDRTINKTSHVARLMLAAVGIDSREFLRSAILEAKERRADPEPTSRDTRGIGDPTGGSGF